MINAETLDNISRALYHKLIESIPEEASLLRDIIASYATEQDGYATLYSIMRTKCGYLQELEPVWGPKWKEGETGYQYLANLKSYLDQQKRRYRMPTKFAIAAEILQQAAHHKEYQLAATSYITRLTSTDRNKPTPNETPSLISDSLAKFESVHHLSVHHYEVH